ncbi:MAG: hypothetical protein AAF242_16235 [Bacteroidota bacterium]
MFSNKDIAIRGLEVVKPRRLGGGIRTATLEQVASLNNMDNDIASKEQVESWVKESKKATKGNNAHWITLAIVIGVLGAGIALVKYKVIKL